MLASENYITHSWLRFLIKNVFLCVAELSRQGGVLIAEDGAAWSWYCTFQLRGDCRLRLRLVCSLYRGACGTMLWENEESAVYC